MEAAPYINNFGSEYKMSKPYLLIVTGRPGAGKTTFAKKFGDEIYMPVISRDQTKEGYVHTFGKSHSELPPESNRIVTEIFFDTLMGLIDGGVSVIAEAAFRHEVWSNRLEPFIEKARIYLLICRVSDEIAGDRFNKRRLENNTREYFHGDNGVDPNAGVYDEPHLDVPAFYIDTAGEYNPTVKELTEKILHLK